MKRITLNITTDVYDKLSTLMDNISYSEGVATLIYCTADSELKAYLNKSDKSKRFRHDKKAKGNVTFKVNEEVHSSIEVLKAKTYSASIVIEGLLKKYNKSNFRECMNIKALGR